jgi:hypothetical protein
MDWSNPRVVGYLPHIILEADDRPAIDQIKERYVGGWWPFEGFNLVKNKDGSYQLEYPGDPPMKEQSRAQLRDELVVLFDYSWVAVINKSAHQIARMD